MLDHTTRNNILDPRRANLGNVGAALVAAAKRQDDADKLARLAEQRERLLDAADLDGFDADPAYSTGFTS